MLITGEKEVLLTIAYADQFDFPLTEVEIHRRLIKSPLAANDLSKILVGLEKIGLIKSQGQFWKLGAGKAEKLIRLKREKSSQKKWDEVGELVKAIGWIPWIEGIVVTGSLAVNNTLAKSDIDLMIVVAPQRLWLCRILVSLSALRAGKRRTWQGNEDNSWCFNLWLDNQHLRLPHKKRNIYSAYEVCQAKWVFDRGGVERKFYQANIWAKNLLPNYFTNNYKELRKDSKISDDKYQPAPILRFIGRRFLDLLNLLIFIPQYHYMYSHMSRERVSLSIAYFHPRSTQGQIYRGWHNSLVNLQRRGKKIVLATGVFDLFHRGHRSFLKKAKKAGDVLVIGVESDVRVKKNKGIGRPIHNEKKRLQQLQAFPGVNLAFILPTKFNSDEEHLALLKLIRPQVLAVSPNTPYLEEKKRLMKRVNGEVKIVCQQQKEISTTQILAGK